MPSYQCVHNYIGGMKRRKGMRKDAQELLFHGEFKYILKQTCNSSERSSLKAMDTFLH